MVETPDARFRVLLIDDNPDDRLLVIRELRREFPGVEVEQVIDAAGLALALDGPAPDVVVTDYQLRWTDGLAVLRAFKQRHPQCPVVMFTGTGSEEVAVEAMKAGLDDYVLKAPKHFVRLSAAVRLARERARQRRAAEEAALRYRDLFERVPVGLFQVSLDGHFMDANPALLAILGYPSLDALREATSGELYLGPMPSERVRELIESEGGMHHFEAQLRRRDGSSFWARFNALAVRDAAGEVTCYEGAVEDVTERKRAEEALEELNEDLRAANARLSKAQLDLARGERLAALGLMAGTIAHELATPLNSVLGYAQLLRQEDLSFAGRSERLTTIESEVVRMIDTIRGVLDRTSQRAVRREPVAVGSLVEEVLALVSSQLAGRRIRATRAVDPGLPPIHGDATGLRQVLLNLLTNAVDAMEPDGQVAVGATLGAARPDMGPHLELRVSDSGHGMSPEVRQRAFEPFYTTKRSDHGTGLGLVIVDQIVRAHGGRLVVDTVEGEGTTMRVLLPLEAR